MSPEVNHWRGEGRGSSKKAVRGMGSQHAQLAPRVLPFPPFPPYLYLIKCATVSAHLVCVVHIYPLACFNSSKGNWSGTIEESIINKEVFPEYKRALRVDDGFVKLSLCNEKDGERS